MFLAIQAHQYQRYRSLLNDMFRLRKRVFIDEAQWNIQPTKDMELDRYDALQPVYLIWCNPAQTKLYGAIRLLPTTGPTLLYDVFRETFPQNLSLVAPGIWEGTRLCIDKDNLANDHPEIDPVRAFGLLLLAVTECARAHGIDAVIANYEPHLARVYARAGLHVEELGRADNYGRFPVCCGLFELSDAVLEGMRRKLEIALPLYRPVQSNKLPNYVIDTGSEDEKRVAVNG